MPRKTRKFVVESQTKDIQIRTKNGYLVTLEISEDTSGHEYLYINAYQGHPKDRSADIAHLWDANLRLFDGYEISYP